MTLKDDVSIEQYKSIADKMIASAKQAPGVHDACYGITEADPHRAYVFVGWDSIDVCVLFRGWKVPHHNELFFVFRLNTSGLTVNRTSSLP